MLTLDDLDITDARTYAEKGYPYREWDLLREQAPVHWYRRPGFEPFWLLTRHEDIAYVSRNPALFSSAQRVTVDTPDAIAMMEAEVDQRAQMLGHDPAEAPALSYMDAPRHRHLRQVMAPCFTPKAVAELSDRFAELAASYVREFTDRLDTHGEADVSRHLAARLPVAAICELVGAPTEDWDDIFQWTEATTGAADPEYQLEGEDEQATFARNMARMNEYVAQLVQERIATQGGTGADVLSRLARAEIDGEPLAFHQILYTVFNLLVAGIGTSRNAATGGIQALLENPEQLGKLVEDPGLLDGAVEEILRWTSIAAHFVRTATQDTEIGGQPIRKGETVAMWYPAANRDGLVFDAPHTFDITRDQNPQVAFGGHGAHVCLGSHLARLELRALLKAVLPLLPRLETVRTPDMSIQHLQVIELKRLIVRRRA